MAAIGGRTMNVKELESKLNRTVDVDVKLDLLEEIAGYYYDKDDYFTASRRYEEAEKLAVADNVKAYYVGQRGVCHYMLGQDGPAEDALLACKRLSHPQEPDFNPEVFARAHYFLGSLYEYRGDPDASLREREVALRHIDHLHREMRWMLLAGMSRNFEEKGDRRRAVQCNMKALSLLGDDSPKELAELYESLGLNYFELGEYEEALSYFSKILEVAPEFERKDDIHVWIGRCCKMRLDFRMALDSYMKILEIKKLSPQPTGDLAWLHIEIASCLYHLKEFHKALEHVQAGLSRPIENREEEAQLRSYLTNCHQALGHYELAVMEGEKTLALAPGFRGLDLMLPNLALSYYHLGDAANFGRCRDQCNRQFPDLGWTRQLNKLTL